MHKTTFIDTFLAYLGPSEAPRAYLEWAAISGLAACLSNRVHTRRWLGAQTVPICPNLYILLVGPSGNYKSYSQKAITSLIQEVTRENGFDIDYRDIVNMYSGSATAEGMFDMMRTRFVKEDGTKVHKPQKGRFYFVIDEFALALGEGDQAVRMLKEWTGMFLGDDRGTATRTGGVYKLRKGEYCLNVFGCTTEDWMQRVITPDMIRGGVPRRIIPVVQGYSTQRVYRSIPPDNQADLKAYLVNRLYEALTMEGAFMMTDKAESLFEKWYNERDEATDEDTISNWLEQPTLAKRLAIVEAVNTHSDYVIDTPHIWMGIERAQQAGRWLGQIMPGLQSSTNESILVLSKIKEAGDGGIQHYEVLRFASSRVKWHKEQLMRWVDTWSETGQVLVTPRTRDHGTVYTYIGKRK